MAAPLANLKDLHARLARFFVSDKPLARLAAGLFIGLGFFALVFLLDRSGFLAKSELLTLDWRYRNRPMPRQHADIGKINFDDASIQLCGTWVWPRTRQVSLIRTLDRYDARAIGYDVFFTERNEVIVERERLIAGAAPAAAFRDHDAEFLEAIERAGMVFFAQFMILPDALVVGSPQRLRAAIASEQARHTPDRVAALELQKPHLRPGTELQRRQLYKAADVVTPLPEFIAAAAGVGYAQIIEDLDKTVRMYPLFMDYDGVVFPSIAMTMLARILEVPIERITIEPGREVVIPEARIPSAGGGEPEVATIRIPVDAHGQMMVNWAGPFMATGLHVSFRIIASIDALNEAKGMARAAGESGETLAAAIRGHLLAEKLVDGEEAPLIAERVALAAAIEERLRDGEAPESLRAYFADRAESTVAAAILAANGHEPAYADLPAAWAEEIRRNVRFFERRGALDEIRPLYFAPPFKTPWNGVERYFSPTDIEGKIFMAGLTGEGTIDLNPMPFEVSYPMVGLHSTALNTILTRQFLRRASPAAAGGLLFAFALAAGLVCAFLGPIAALIGCLLLVGAHTLLAISAWRIQGLWLPWVAPTLAIALVYLQEIALELIRAARARQKVRSIFSTMVSPAVLKLMEDEPDRFSLTGERKPATIFFSGLEGFNEVMRREAPYELSAILSHYLTPTSEIIMEYGGYIDKYEGHIIMADFGVPLGDPDHAWKCCFAAIEQQMDIRAFELFVLARYGVNVTVHMGLNSGQVSAGNMGSERKMQYTVMGDAVNVAARFRPANGIYDSRIISGEAIEPLVRDRVELRRLDRLLLKGKTVPTTLYEVMGWKEDAYRAFRRGKPLPESLLARWRAAPPEKIFGYARWWRAMEKERAAPMAGEIAAFFEAHFNLAERIMFHAAAVMVERLAESLLALSAAVRPEKSFSRADVFRGGDWRETLADQSREVEEIQRRIEAANGIDEPLRSERRLQAETLHGKIRSLRENLDKKSRSGIEAVDRTLASIRERLEGKTLDNALERLQESQAEWRREVERFVKTLDRRAGEYHDLMARLGSLSENRRRVRELYEEGLRLHWNRDWDAALARLEAARRLDPADGPTQKLVARIEGYRATPPPASWRGEFVQRKK